MDTRQLLSQIKNRIGQGDAEEAIEALIALLDSDPKYAELAQAARLNQADLYQTKAAVLKGTIPGDEARVATNQATDKILEIIRRLETGKLSLTEAMPAEQEPPTETRWRYYLMGAFGALLSAFLVWYFGFREGGNCPDFSKNVQFKIMLLPLKQTGEQRTQAEPEVDIMAELNQLFEKTSRNAVVKIKKNWESDYPSPDEAAALARECDVHMIVYGRANRGYLDIEYRLLDAGGVKAVGDTTFTQLLAPNNSGSYSHTSQAVARFLFTVITFRMGHPIAQAELDKLLPPTLLAMAETSSDTKALAGSGDFLDTTYHFVRAEIFYKQNKLDSAIREYQFVLEKDPSNQTALRNLGIHEYQRGNFPAAARNLEAAVPDAKSAKPSIIKLRTDAFLRSGEPDKAERDLEVLKKNAPTESAFIEKTQKAVNDSTLAIKSRREKLDKNTQYLAKTQSANLTVKPSDRKKAVKVAELSDRVGEHDKAIKIAAEVVRKDPTNVGAVVILMDAHMQKGDTTAARKVWEKASKSKTTARDVLKELPKVAPLVLEKNQ